MKKALTILVVLMVTVMAGCTAGQNPQPSEQSGQPTSQNSTDTSTFIGEERAKQIALERAGITADGVIFDRVELDRDDGVWHYEVEFRKGTTEYDADIRADDGTIIKWEADTID